jgi:hypothetical protein
MSKADILLKKAASFEKLVASSDRKAFFSSLAQQVPQLDSSIRQGINSLIANLDVTKPGNPISLKLMDMLNGSANLSQLPSLLEQAANTIPGDRTVQVQHALDLASKVQQMFSAPEASSQENVMYMPADKIIDRKPLPPIDPKVQEALNTLNAQDPFMLAPLTPDGKRGPETNSALLSFKGRYMKDQPGAKLADIIQAVRLYEAHFRLQPK